MPTDVAKLLDATTQLVERLPSGVIGSLADAVTTVPTGAWPLLHNIAQGVLATPYYREQVGGFVRAWQTYAPDLPPASVALALRAAAHTLTQQRRAQTLELVWTGPSSAQPLRHTAQVLQTLIDEALRDLLIVSYAVYDIPDIGQALVRAAERGVQLHFVIESPQESSGRTAYNSLLAFGPHITQRATVYHWPLEQRPKDTSGRSGSLHVKCAVADARTLLISSANLTRYALNLNMELGMRIDGGPLPRQVTEHFMGLIQQGILPSIRP